MRTKQDQERMPIVVIGHVDHGKSTLIGRLLAESGALPKGKIELLVSLCKERGKRFEYAYLIDALKNEQAQGITIDTARCFFSTLRRDYILNDAPGHLEFLKNMITGAGRSEAAIIVIDVREGIRDTSKIHGALVSLLGIRQVVVCVNKMDTANFEEQAFLKIVEEFRDFLDQVHITPRSFIPSSGKEGANLVSPSPYTKWYDGPTLIEAIDSFTKENLTLLPFRMRVQDIYEEIGNKRKGWVGRLESGTIQIGEEIHFYPSQVSATIVSLEGSSGNRGLSAGYSTALTLQNNEGGVCGELIAKRGEPKPKVSSSFVSHVFWIGKTPLFPGKTLRLKMGACIVEATLAEVQGVFSANQREESKPTALFQNEIGKCAFVTSEPIAFDLISENASTGRFVLIEDYHIAGGGVFIR